MYKRLILYSFLLLPALCWPTIFSANHTEPASLPTLGAETTCAAPPPAWVVATTVTPTSISLQWEHNPPTQVTYYYKVTGYDMTSATALPTYYTTANTLTYSGLTPGHTYQFGVSASYCPDGPYGSARETVQSTIIIDFIVELQNPCTPTNRRDTGPGVQYQFCVQQSNSQQPPYTNAFVGELKYNDNNTLKFGVALTGTTMHIGQIINPPNPAFSFSYTPGVPQGTSVDCYYVASPSQNLKLFTVDSYYFAPPSGGNLTNFRVTFNGTFPSFKYCSACGGGNEPRSSEGDSHQADEETPQSPDKLLLTPPRPNPFSAFAAFEYELTEASPVEISLYDPMGRLVQVVENTPNKAPGRYEAAIDGANLPDGVYFLRVQTSQNREVFSLVKRE